MNAGLVSEKLLMKESNMEYAALALLPP